MPEFTGNIHNLELALPFPGGGTPPGVGGGPLFVIGRTFGDDGSDALDVWINSNTLTPYDPPDGPPVQIQIRTLIACTHGWLRFVAAGQPVPGLVTRNGTSLVVTAPTLVLEVWSTLHNSLDRMAEDGSYLAELTEAGRGGRPALAHLLYENVDFQTQVFDPAIEALIAEARPDPFFTAADRATMVQKFRAGEIRILARAGRIIGEAAPGDPGPPPVPPGASVGDRRVTFRAVDRLGQLFDPGFFFRRVQELADIITLPGLDNTLIPSREAVKGHSMPKLTPRRRILDWRDEVGRPVPNARFAMPPVTGGATDFVTANAAGLWVGPTIADGTNPPIEQLTVIPEADSFRLGTLPDSSRSYGTLDREQMADDYLVVSAINLEQWFPARIPPDSPSVEPLRRFSEGNRVTALIDGRRTYSLIYRALRRTFRDDDFTGVEEGGQPAVDGPPFADVDGHRIYIAGWMLSPELWLPDFTQEADPVPDYDGQAVMTPGRSFNARGHLMGILRAAIATGVDVRTLLWRQQQEEPDHRKNNTAAVIFINQEETGRRGEAILDAVGRTVGSHHQKAVVVQNADGRLAFVGGIDLALGRWDSQEHLPNDERARGGRNIANDGWHDTHSMIEGPAVDDIEANFRQRWNAHPNAAQDGRTNVPARPPAEEIDPIPEACHYVQINRTLPGGVPHFPFADPTAGDPGARLARVNAIRQARRFVYIEEQYLTMFDWEDYEALVALQGQDALDFAPGKPDTIAAVLRARLVGPNPLDFVAILIPRRLGEDPRFTDGVIYELRKRFITFLTHGLSDDLKRERLLVFHLRNRSGQFTYVHAKNMVIDDVWASIGSSNLGYRSLTYDSELNCDVIDGEIVRGSRRYARNFRVELWRQHLRLGQGGAPLVLDPRRGFEMLRAAAEGDLARPHAIERYDPSYIGDDLNAPGAPPLYNPANPNHEIVRTHLIDPDGRDPDDPLLDYFALLELIAEA
jgi:phosphatidylserine/phosphatidylglycerophosphate/cardiolipin synthase-like enzyme